MRPTALSACSPRGAIFAPLLIVRRLGFLNAVSPSNAFANAARRSRSRPLPKLASILHEKKSGCEAGLSNDYSVLSVRRFPSGRLGKRSGSGPCVGGRLSGPPEKERTRKTDGQDKRSVRHPSRRW